ncbi:tyrosine--tRNA ligase [Anoxybacter fermentans]|uniref:Tyrosine--tRNA ligase n=1 Tax=Anoxybacter fermentans TaxID=1323375 RepID=A0A3Q9HSN3_9FIRM|nr:tyrosine--tRNA ligase [Anoxybacter fermentans]AZR74892.1 tyrosine--tRNA ligase [Anoxybacter fermentans]
MTIEEQVEFLMRGVEQIISKEELVEKLKKAEKTGKPLKVKLGMDPTAPDIHLGHTVVLNKLRQFQDLGHEVILIIGDFTAMIGDPTGKNETRPQLTREEVIENAKTYQEQVFKILDKEKTTIRYNSEWLAKMNFADVINLCSKYTVARMLERDDFSKRMKEERPISIHEFFYPLMQGYDSVAIEADIELGGTDQLFNLLVGRSLQKDWGQESQVIMMTPILEGLDGVEKMSKSKGNYIGVNFTPEDMFGKIMSIPDELIIRYFTLLTDIPMEEIEKMEKGMKDGSVHPMEAKKALGRAIVTRFHDEKAAERAQAEFEKVFSKGGLPEDMPKVEITDVDLEEGKIWIITLLTKANLVKSNSEGRRMIQQGAVSVDGEKITDIKAQIEPVDGMVIRVGKRRFAQVKVK